ncbi:PhzF family phenazine biosynthesis protein [Ferrimicrobium acidiphilum]|uniref:Putative isomerase YddE n=1 Tax=Ferrimicrobium acidiphilum DSM 19497 TaxID=1121877 RepID=A0A0D8FVF8_9ACTN|nr:PhzF family phenazine biosynthesis protein [Ferrimicrobium acidiphilum]KJE77255.1 putative isomerase YddE [Ferrimicrobium acidiphilum DSM 19497]
MPFISDLQLVDAFTDRPFAGNPAAVAFCEGFPDDHYLQAIAAEMNLSETAFVAPRPDGSYDLRWFTPTTEVALCGHATLAAAHALGGVATFHTASGILKCSNGKDGEITMDFPLDPPTPVDAPAQFASSSVVWTGRGVFDMLVVFDDANAVRSYTPDPTGLSSIDARCVIITAPGDHPDIDCVSRVFGPRVGVLEDPVTGSAHCTLAAYWSKRLEKDRLYAEQASPRGGFVSMNLNGDRVSLGGSAVTIGHLKLAID